MLIAEEVGHLQGMLVVKTEFGVLSSSRYSAEEPVGHKPLRLPYQTGKATSSGEQVGGVGWVRGVVERWEVGGTNQRQPVAKSPESWMSRAEAGGQSTTGARTLTSCETCLSPNLKAQQRKRSGCEET